MNTKILLATLVVFTLVSCSPIIFDTAIGISTPTSLALETAPVATISASAELNKVSEAQPTDRANYRKFETIPDLSACDTSQYPQTDFWSITENPILLGMCVAGYPNTYKLEPSLVQVFYVSRENVVVMVTDNNWMSDDSTRSVEMRIDLVAKDINWVVEWMGVRWKCKIEHGHQDWSPDLCT
jgi:hypothetical protein